MVLYWGPARSQIFTQLCSASDACQVTATLCSHTASVMIIDSHKQWRSIHTTTNIHLHCVPLNLISVYGYVHPILFIKIKYKSALRYFFLRILVMVWRDFFQSFRHYKSHSFLIKLYKPERGNSYCSLSLLPPPVLWASFSETKITFCTIKFSMLHTGWGWGGGVQLNFKRFLGT